MMMMVCGCGGCYADDDDQAVACYRKMKMFEILERFVS